MTTMTFPQNRLPAEVREINIYARYAAMGMLRSKLCDALRLLLESGVPSAAEIDPRDIAELLTSLTFTLVEADDSPELFQNDPAMAYMPLGGLEYAVQVLRRTGDHVKSGLYAVPDKRSALSPEVYGQTFIDVADATQHMVDQIRDAA